MAGKQCPDCGSIKRAEDFGRNRTRPDGLSFYCLDCNRQRSGAWYRRSRQRLGKPVRDLSWVPDGHRWCPNCRSAVPHQSFSRNSSSSSGFGARCLSCTRQIANEEYFVRKYGLTRAQVADLRVAQGDMCAICGDQGPEHLDHDHESGVVRALLCQRCNFGLGQFRDDPDLLRRAAEYVERHALVGGSGAEPGAGGAATTPASTGASRRAVSPGYTRWLALTGG